MPRRLTLVSRKGAKGAKKTKNLLAFFAPLRETLFGVVLLASPAFAAPLLPPRMGDFSQTSAGSYTPPDLPVFREYGLDLAERASYAAGHRKFEISLLRAKDPTGAFGMFQWLRPRDSQPVDQGERAVEKGDTVLFQYGNYVVSLRGVRPEEEHLQALLGILPRFERTAAPPVVKQLPVEGRLANSERFIQGPVALQKLAPNITPSAVAFHLGAEGELAEYTAADGRLTLILFYYPTPQMARSQLEEFHKLSGLVAKRSGLLIAAVVNPFSRDEAEKLLSRVRYEATLTWSQSSGMRNENVGEFLLGIVLLCLVLVGFMIAAGLGVGGLRVLLGKWFPGSRFDAAANPQVTRLNLSGR